MMVLLSQTIPYTAIKNTGKPEDNTSVCQQVNSHSLSLPCTPVQSRAVQYSPAISKADFFFHCFSLYQDVC